MSTKLQTVIKYCVVLIVIVHWTACALKLVTEYTLNECNYRGAEYEDGPCLCGNQPVRRVHDNSSQSHFSAATRPVITGSRGERPRTVTPSSRRRVDGVEVAVTIQHGRAVKF